MDAETVTKQREGAADIKGVEPFLPEDTQSKAAGTVPPGNGEQIVTESPQGTPDSELARIQAMGGNDQGATDSSTSSSTDSRGSIYRPSMPSRRPDPAAPDAWSAPIAESAGSAWGGNKPEFLPNTPEDMPKPVEWNVTKEQTVSGQVESLMDHDNPVFRTVQESIKRAAAARGGQNSTMAARSATMAMANLAFQIGSQDAATFARSAEFNAAMANQFGLAEQQFMHNAMLSDQNFRQGVYIQRIQNQAQMDIAFMQTSAQMGIAQLQADTQLQMQENDYNNQLHIMETNHGYQLETMEVGHGYDVDTQNRAFQASWQLGEQQGRQNIEGINAQGQWQTRAATVNFQRTQILQWQSERGANNRAFMQTIADIRANPNITSAQATAAYNDALTQFNAMNAMTDSWYGNPSPSAGDPGAGAYDDFSYDYTTFPPPELGGGSTIPPPGGGG